jgi:hypothetical protein
MSEAEALKSLGAFPVVQAAVAIIIILVGILAFLRGGRDRKNSDAIPTIPPWLMMGPAHDAIGAIHDMAEQSRQQTKMLERIESVTSDLLKETHNNTSVLEMIRNESRLR